LAEGGPKAVIPGHAAFVCGEGIAYVFAFPDLDDGPAFSLFEGEPGTLGLDRPFSQGNGLGQACFSKTGRTRGHLAGLDEMHPKVVEMEGVGTRPKGHSIVSGRKSTEELVKQQPVLPTDPLHLVRHQGPHGRCGVAAAAMPTTSRPQHQAALGGVGLGRERTTMEASSPPRLPLLLLLRTGFALLLSSLSSTCWFVVMYN